MSKFTDVELAMRRCIAELEQQLAAKDAELAEDKRQLTNLRGLLDACEQKLALYNSQINELEAQLTTAQASIARKQALLKQLEYIPVVPGWRMCPVCSGRERHVSDCALAAELKE